MARTDAYIEGPQGNRTNSFARFEAARTRSGHLYQPGDYTAAATLARTLVSDASARTAMGSAARSAVEKLGWMAAIRRIRDQQYQRAIRTFRAHKRFCQQAYPPCMCMLRLILPKLFAQATSADQALFLYPRYSCAVHAWL